MTLIEAWRRAHRRPPRRRTRTARDDAYAHQFDQRPARDDVRPRPMPTSRDRRAATREE